MRIFANEEEQAQGVVYIHYTHVVVGHAMKESATAAVLEVMLS